MNALKSSYVFLLILLLTACAPLTPSLDSQSAPSSPLENPSTTDSLQENNIKAGSPVPATALSSWTLSGAMAARNKDKSWSASLNWQQQGINTYHIRLLGPLGGGTVLIEKEGGIVTYKDGPKTVSSNQADELLQKQTGIRLPVNNLYYWVRGLPAPGAVQTTQYDGNYHLLTLKQAGYTIHYLSYTLVGQTALPSKIHLEGHGVTIKLVIKRWNV